MSIVKHPKLEDKRRIQIKSGFASENVFVLKCSLLSEKGFLLSRLDRLHPRDPNGSNLDLLLGPGDSLVALSYSLCLTLACDPLLPLPCQIMSHYFSGAVPGWSLHLAESRSHLIFCGTTVPVGPVLG